MKALILAGGFATRLRPLSCSRPKALFPLVNKPLLQWTFERLANSGVDEAILAVNALTQFYIRQFKPPHSGLKIRYSIDPPKKPLGTGGPVKKAENLLGHDEPFIVLNGDIFAEIDYKEMLETHKRNSALITIALCHVEDPSSFGVVEINGENIKRFVEKPRRSESPSKLINAGAYVLSPEIFNYIPEGRAVSMEREVFPKIAQENRLFGSQITGLWMDVGKPQEYLQANKTILDSISSTLKIPRPVGNKIKEPVAIARGVSFGKGCVIGPYAILGKNVKVGRNVTITDTVVFPDAEIGDNVSLHGAIIGECARIGEHANLGKGCIIADQVKVKDKVHLCNGTTICPAKEISENIL